MKAAAANDVASRKSETSDSPHAATTNAQATNPVWQALAFGAQAKLAVSTPDDPAEHEADRVADRVMRMPAPIVQRKCAACGASPTPCPKCEQEQQLQRKSDSDVAPPTAVSAPHLGSGAPLDGGARAFLEPRFNRSFDHVRVHTDDTAATSAAALGARAFTLGSDIAFASGQYQPATTEGQRLIAHELTHVVQQSSVAHVQAKHDEQHANPVSEQGVSISMRGIEPTIQRACVAGLIPRLSCCIPGMPARRIGTIAHSQLQIGAGLISPGTIGEVAIPPLPHGLPQPSRGWRFADLYDTDPALPVKAPSRAGLPPFLGRFHPEVNPLGLPVDRVPPSAVGTSAGIGEIKPLSVHGLTAGPADLARNILQYDVWSMSTSGAPVSMSPIIPGGVLGHPLNFLVGIQTIPGLYNYCCLDARRVARAIARALRRVWEAVKELWRQFMEFLEEYWEIILIVLLIIIAIILIIVFWEAIVAALAAIGAALLRFLLWLIQLILRGGRVPVPRPVPAPIPAPVPAPPPPIPFPRPVPVPAPVPAPAPPLAAAASILISLREFVSSHMGGAPPAADSGATGDEDVDEAPPPDGSSDATQAPELPIATPPEVEVAGEEAAADVEGLLGGSVDSLAAILGSLPGMPTEPTGVGDALLAGAPAMLGPLMQRMHGSELHDEARQMIGEFFTRAPGARPSTPMGADTASGGEAPIA